MFEILRRRSERPSRKCERDFEFGELRIGRGRREWL